ncbi:MAG: hydroxyacid dehydrogenase [bacterium]
MTFKILCTDGFSKAGLDELAKNTAFEVAFIKALTHEELLEKIHPFNALIIRSASRVSADVIEAGKSLRIIARAGVGVDNIDVPAATRRNIMVINAPAGNTVSTAELSFGMLLALARHIPQAACAMANGKWEKKKFQGTEVAKKVLGVIGMGRVGREVARRAMAFRMTVVGFDPFLDADQFDAAGVERVALDKIFKTADYITVHTPLTPETENLISAKEFKMMKPSACVINCARGGIVNEADLAEALRQKTIAGAALDVYTKEPFESTIFQGLDNCILTPHLGASTNEAQDAVAVEAAYEVAQYLTTGQCANCVNLRSET